MDTTTLMGGKELSVTLEGGTTETLTIRQLKVKELPALMESLDDESAQAALYCDKDGAFVDSLTRESFEAVILAGEEANADFFFRWAERQLKRMERLMPDVLEKKKAALLTLRPLPPKAPPNAA
jgi:hypothetical protein